MIPSFLLPEMTVQENGSGPAIPLGDQAGQVLQFTLGISRIVEQESLDVSIWGSTDGSDWGKSPVAAFPQKFYCGTYTVLVDLSTRPEVKWLRVEWKLHRWGRGSLKPLFGFYVFAEAFRTAPLAAAAAS